MQWQDHVSLYRTKGRYTQSSSSALPLHLRLSAPLNRLSTFLPASVSSPAPHQLGLLRQITLGLLVRQTWLLRRQILRLIRQATLLTWHMSKLRGHSMRSAKLHQQDLGPMSTLPGNTMTSPAQLLQMSRLCQARWALLQLACMHSITIPTRSKLGHFTIHILPISSAAPILLQIPTRSPLASAVSPSSKPMRLHPPHNLPTSMLLSSSTSMHHQHIHRLSSHPSLGTQSLLILLVGQALLPRQRMLWIQSQLIPCAAEALLTSQQNLRMVRKQRQVAVRKQRQVVLSLQSRKARRWWRLSALVTQTMMWRSWMTHQCAQAHTCSSLAHPTHWQGCPHSRSSLCHSITTLTTRSSTSSSRDSQLSNANNRLSSNSSRRRVMLSLLGRRQTCPHCPI